MLNRLEGNTNSSEFWLLKFLPLAYYHSHFLAATLDFTSFFTTAFLGTAHFFTAWLFLGLDSVLMIHISKKKILFLMQLEHLRSFWSRTNLERGLEPLLAPPNLPLKYA